jgi:hypothetical protein
MDSRPHAIDRVGNRGERQLKRGRYADINFRAARTDFGTAGRISVGVIVVVVVEGAVPELPQPMVQLGRSARSAD